MDFRKTKSNWVRPSVNPMSADARRTSSPRAAGRDYHPRPPWDQKSEELVDDFERDLQLADEAELQHPWTLRPEDVSKMQRERENAKNYHFQSMFAPEPMSSERERQLAEYKMNPPFLCGYNYEESHARPAKKLDNERKNPKTLSPWEYGALPSEPVRRTMFARPKTALWENLENGGRAGGSNQAPPSIPSSGDPVLDSLRQKVRERGASGLIGLSKKFRIMDDDGSGTLNYEEFRKGMKECGLEDVTERALKHLFLYFDKDDSGVISYDEFLIGIRGAMNARRKEIVAMAFHILDRDKSGAIDLHDIIGVYDASMHPEVMSGKMTEKEALQQFLSTFEQNTHAKSIGKGDNTITLEEFQEYYAALSASIDSDDYFELMVRNAWHISGGSNPMCENTTNRRVLVTNKDGTQCVREVKNDIGISVKDAVALQRRLQEQQPDQEIAKLDIDDKAMRRNSGRPPSVPQLNIGQSVPRSGSFSSNKVPANQSISHGIPPRSVKPVPLTQIFSNQASNAVQAANMMSSRK